MNEELKEQTRDILELRKITGSGLIDCKKALEETYYIMKDAEQWLKDHWAEPFKYF